MAALNYEMCRALYGWDRAEYRAQLEETRIRNEEYRARLDGRPGSGSDAVRMAIKEHRAGILTSR